MSKTKINKQNINENEVNEDEVLHKELHQRYTELEYMNNHLQELDKQYQDMIAKVKEIATIKSSLEDLKQEKEDTEILVPISNGIFVKAKLSKNDEYLVNVGSDVVVKKNTENTKKLLDEQAKEINKYKNNIYEQMINISEQMQTVQNEINEKEKNHHHH